MEEQGMNRSSFLRHAFLLRSFSRNVIFVPASFLFSKWRFCSCLVPLPFLFWSSFHSFWKPSYTHPRNPTYFSHFWTKLRNNLKLYLRTTLENLISTIFNKKLKFCKNFDEFFFWKERKKERFRYFFRSSIFFASFRPRCF